MGYRLLFFLLLPAIAFSYTVVRLDGKVFSGELIQQSSEGIVLKDHDGVMVKFLAHQIDWNQTTEQIRKQEKTSSLSVVQEKPAEKRFETKEISRQRREWTGESFSFDFKDIDIKDFFRFIADISGLNVILDPAVKGTMTLKLTEVPWDQALDLVTRTYGLGYTLEGNVIRIAPLAKFVQEERARAEAERQAMLNQPLVTVVKRLSYAKAAEIDRIVKRLLTPRGSSIADQRTNTIIITDIGGNVESVLDTISGLD